MRQRSWLSPPHTDPPWDDENSWDEPDGDSVEAPEPYRAPPQVGRNEPCPFGRTYKECCGQ